MKQLIPKCIVQPAVSGNWRVETFCVSDSDAKASAIRDRHRAIEAGVYTRLMCGDCVVMSDTRAELTDHYNFVQRASGNVLIHGLGLGIVLNAVQQKLNVQAITVVELEQDVINMVWPYFSDNPRITLIHGNAFDWPLPKGAQWDYAWHDIWPTLCADHLPEMARLKRRFCRRVGWQACWAQEEIQYHQKHFGW